MYDYLVSHGMTDAGAAGMMGNMYYESGLIANRVEVLCLTRLKQLGKYYTDATYTAFVDDGTITRAQFLNPIPGKQYGYGLCQWTSPGRKGKLYDFAKERNVSMGDQEMQLDFLIKELKESYQSVWKVLSTTSSVREASDIVLKKYEQPADTGTAVQEQRYNQSLKYYELWKGGENMTETQAINKVLSVAEAEVGYLEKASATNLDNKSANAGSANYTKYGKEMHALQPKNMDYPAAWCDCFVDWCFYKAFGADLARKMLCGDFDDYTVNSANYYKQAGRYTQTAKRGYQIFFRNSGGICHTGLVYKVDSDKVYTIEGNANNSVKKREYYLIDSSIDGYGMPKYYLAESGEEKSDHKYTGTCTVKTVQLIKGDYGDAVKSLQVLLKHYGYKGKDGKALTIDGQFGDNTEYAVTQCQKHAGMTNINFGTVSSMTWAVLLN